jgi:hypothetical protein
VACPRWRHWSSEWFALAARLSVAEVEQIRDGIDHTQEAA